MSAALMRLDTASMFPTSWSLCAASAPHVLPPEQLGDEAGTEDHEEDGPVQVPAEGQDPDEVKQSAEAEQREQDIAELFRPEGREEAERLPTQPTCWYTIKTDF